MNTQTYTHLLAHPQEVSTDQLQQLARVIEEFPFFQSARALQLKGLKNENSFLYNDALKVTAAYTTDRDILFEYITSDQFVQHDISEIILQQSDAVKEMTVIHEDVSEVVSQEIHEQLKTEMKKAEAILNPDLFERKTASIIEISETDSQKEVPSETIKETESVTEEIQPNEPLPFTQKDTHSFGEWLKLTQARPIDRTLIKNTKEETSVSTTSNEKQRKFELIEKFIQDRPKLEPTERLSKNKNLAKPYTQSPDTLMTETLAKVYLQQKNYKKAIQAYKILILKNPEKSGFFADQIRAVEKLIKTEES